MSLQDLKVPTLTPNNSRTPGPYLSLYPQWPPWSSKWLLDSVTLWKAVSVKWWEGTKKLDTSPTVLTGSEAEYMDTDSDQMGDLTMKRWRNRLREFQWLPQDYTACKWQGQDSNPRLAKLCLTSSTCSIRATCINSPNVKGPTVHPMYRAMWEVGR